MLEQTTRWDPGEVEQRIFERWMQGGWFHPAAEGTAEENFSVAIPPPNVTGALHMGHALNGSIQDALVRIRRMQGRNTLWILGTDHAGIATQAVVEKELRSHGTDRHELGRAAFTERVWEWKQQYGSTIVEQYKRLGASCDYERERFTLDDGLRAGGRTASSSRSTRRATSTATTTSSTGTPAPARRSPTSRSRTARSPTRSTRSPTRSRTAAS